VLKHVFAKIDFECDDLINDMFHHFLRTVK
jgi:hypothetical protein